MPAIGYVTRNGEGFKGQLKTVSIRAEIEIIPNRSKTSEAQPGHRVLAGGSEVGGAGSRPANARARTMSRSRSPPPNSVVVKLACFRRRAYFFRYKGHAGRGRDKFL